MLTPSHTALATRHAVKMQAKGEIFGVASVPFERTLIARLTAADGGGDGIRWVGIVARDLYV
jgi:hypothetical protein